MKIFIIRHPKLGYLGGNKDYRYWTPNIQYSRKFNRRCDATNCKNNAAGFWLLQESEILFIKLDECVFSL